jgi:membrane protease YdiL (CAAX protease family)
MLIARGIGFLFLVFFIPDVLRGVGRELLPGYGFRGLVSGTSEAPFVSLAVVVVVTVVSFGFVRLHARLGGEAVLPRPLARLDRRWFADWGRGFGYGAAAATLAIAPLFLTGALRIRGWAERDAGAGFVLALVVALLLKAAHEEFGFRGPAFRDWSAAIGSPLAAAFLAGSFALIHARNPAFDRMALLGIFLAGFALAGFVRARGDLGMAAGAHAGWNVFVGLVGSVPVSGYSLSGRLLEVEPSSSPAAALWSGGDFGVEGGLAGLAALFALGLFAWRMRAVDEDSGA